MAIAIKHIKNVSIFSGGHDREIECYNGRYANISLHFEAGDHRYHVWMTHTVANGWQLGSILYKNLIDQPKYGRHKTGHLQVDAHRAAVDHAINVMEIGRFSDGKVIGLDGAAITRLVETHNAGVRHAKSVAQAEANTARAAVIRSALRDFCTRTEADNFQRSIYSVAMNATDDQLNALDHLFNVTI